MSNRVPVLRRTGDRTEIILNGVVVFRDSIRTPAIVVGFGEPVITSGHGAYRIRPGLRWKRPLQLTDAREADSSIVLRFGSAVGDTVSVTCRPINETGLVRLAVETAGGAAHNRLWLTLPAAPGEPTFGGGEQFSRFNLRGSRLPLWSSEQGIGRGFNLTTLAANLHSGSGGAWHWTYFPQPTYVTSTGRVVHVDSTAYACFDFKRSADELEIWETGCEIVLGAESTLEGAVMAISRELGTQPRLPNWVDEGMWLGLQGGKDVVAAKIGRARESGIPLSAIWVQDWVGRRVTSFGSQLFWDWRYDEKRYPDLPNFAADLRNEGIRFLGYINPFLAIEGQLYKEASRKGYCVKDPSGADAMIVVTTFPAALVDLSNPDARQWLVTIIRENLIGAGLSGWMADYGEYLPENAVLANGDPLTYHNRFPAEWAKLNFEAVSGSGRLDDVVVFMRAGHTGTSRYAHSIWAGDQMVDWSRHDGLPSVIPASLSSGMVGIGVHHSDIGGFTSLFSKKRTKELFMRWAEHAAFTPIMRSHESNRPDQNWQWDGDAESISHLARMATIYTGLTPYRRVVLDEYYSTGLPSMRPVVLHYPGTVGRRVGTYMFGRDLLVHPIIRKAVKREVVHLPADGWTHLWTGRQFDGGKHVVDAPPGRPPVFFRTESNYAELFNRIAGV